MAAISRPAIEKAACPTSTATSCTTPDQGARTMPRSCSALAAASAASAALSWASRSTSCSFGSVPCMISWRLASSSVRFCVTTACACATCASRASSESTAMMSPFSTHEPRRTRSSVRMPPVRAVTTTRLSASVRPDRASLRLCGASRVGVTATRNSFFASPSPVRTAARLSALSCGRKWPDAIHSAAAATRPTAVMRLAFIGALLRSRARPSARRRHQCWCRRRGFWFRGARPGVCDLGRAGAQHVAHDVHEDRDHRLGIEIGLQRAPPPHAVGDEHQHGDDAVEIDVARNIAALGGGAKQVHQPVPHVGVEGGGDARDLRVAARLPPSPRCRAGPAPSAAWRSSDAPCLRAR